jgi:hypothetical protein
MTMGAACNIAGLVMNLIGVVLLFLYGMPFRVRTGGGQVNWQGIVDQATVKSERLYDRRSWLGLTLIILGTVSQIVAAVL